MTDERRPADDRPGARRFERFAWLVLGYTVLVIIWGAVVRATGSGAGCGAHWPLCNGEVVPLAPGTATLIEFTHRTTSGVVLLLGAALVVWAHRAFPPGHAARRAAAWSLVFVLIEAAIGAGIVLLELVEDNATPVRAAYIAGHLANTLLLVGAMTMTVFAARPRPLAWSPASAGTLARRLVRVLAGLVLVGASGAVVALGDTLFPTSSLAAGFAADFDPASHFLIRLRIWHPILAVAVALYVAVVVVRSGAMHVAALGGPARAMLWILAAQMALGAINLLLLAPLSLQMAHLALSNVLWIAVVWVWRLAGQAVTRS